MRLAADFKVVIPARFDSSRLPGKVLREIAGRPMLAHVYQRALDSGAADVVIATDDQRVLDVAQAFGAQVCMTSPAHQSGTDRVNEVAMTLGWPQDAIVVNQQGDEPMMPAELISQAAEGLAEHADAAIATLGATLDSVEDWSNPNIVKVVRDAQGMALYFSRAQIPWDRDGHIKGQVVLPDHAVLRHIGIYAYRVSTLKRVSAMPQSTLEKIEALEQLRAMSAGLKIHVAQACKLPGPGVDTEEDLIRVTALMQA